MLARLEVAREQLTRALQAGDRAVLERLDPLLDERMPGVEDLRGLADTPAPFVPDATGRWIRALGVVAAVALVGGLGLPDLRNHLSDGALCRAIGPWSTRAQHDWYLRVGARCRDRVRQEDIPAAAFERARRADTRGAYRGVKSVPTNSLPGAQADEAVRNLAHRAMEEARAKGTLAAVLRCRATHSVWRDPPLRAEAARAHDLADDGAAPPRAAPGQPRASSTGSAGTIPWRSRCTCRSPPRRPCARSRPGSARQEGGRWTGGCPGSPRPRPATSRTRRSSRVCGRASGPSWRERNRI